MKKTLVLLLIAILSLGMLAGCGQSRTKAMAGTYVHEADETFPEIVIVHDGKDVTVTIDGKEYDAEYDEKEAGILVEGEHAIWETFADKNGEIDEETWKFDSEHIGSVDILIPDAKDWIEGDYETDAEGGVRVLLFKK